ncbi:MAG: aminomethyl-transferring glycine dehydrogenase subunit GcvPA [Lachnospiraceae bacterium]|nr:aminomethyl-transferring glycine dehydrogenase subunit GcvPA [Lachnospiraceae bacterium]
MGSYVPNTAAQQQEMLRECGFSGFEDLYRDIPDSVLRRTPLDIPAAASELEVRRILEDMAGKNRIFRTIFRGAGAYHHYIPAIVNTVAGREEFRTAYTPYQAEISQGVLQSIFEYQTDICELTGMEVSNAGVYDGAVAAAEACEMCRDRKRKKILVSSTVDPKILSVVRTYSFGRDTEVALIPEKDGVTDLEELKALLTADTAGVLMQQPNYYGCIEAMDEATQIAHAAGAKMIASCNPISLAVLQTPGEYGADIAVGEGQPLGIPLSFGGPYLGFMAAREKMMRQMPGRIVGETVDSEGNRAFVLTLQAREQHIRREKASSNICSNEALCALRAGVYLTAMGPEGLRSAAAQSCSKAHYLREKLTEAGFEAAYGEQEFFHEFVTICPDTKAVLKALADEGILGGLALDEHRMLWCATEMNTRDEMDRAAQICREVIRA